MACGMTCGKCVNLCTRVFTCERTCICSRIYVCSSIYISVERMKERDITIVHGGVRAICVFLINNTHKFTIANHRTRQPANLSANQPVR